MKNNNRISIASIKTDLEWIKATLKDIQENNKKNDEKIDEVCIGFRNHLIQHENLRKEMFTKLGLFLTALGIISAIIMKMWLG